MRSMKSFAWWSLSIAMYSNQQRPFQIMSLMILNLFVQKRDTFVTVTSMFRSAFCGPFSCNEAIKLSKINMVFYFPILFDQKPTLPGKQFTIILWKYWLNLILLIHLTIYNIIYWIQKKIVSVWAWYKICKI